MIQGETKHTPTPWKKGGRSMDVLKGATGEEIVSDESAMWVAIVQTGGMDNGQANADLIIAAVNERDALLKVRDAAQAYLDSEKRIDGTNAVQCLQRLRAALATTN